MPMSDNDIQADVVINKEQIRNSTLSKRRAKTYFDLSIQHSVGEKITFSQLNEPGNSEIKSKSFLYFSCISTYKKNISVAYVAHRSKKNKLHSDQENQIHCKFLPPTVFIAKIKTEQIPKCQLLIFFNVTLNFENPTETPFYNFKELKLFS